MRRFIAFLAVLVVLIVPAYAEQLPEDETAEPTPTPYAPTMEEFLWEVNQVVPYPEAAPEVDENGMFLTPPVVSAVPDLEAASADEPVAYAAGSVYPGTWNSGVLDYFGGVMLQHPGLPYCAYRESQYLYCLYYGKGLTYSGGVFSGSGDYLRYNTYNGSYSISRGSGSLSIDGSSGFVYSNLDGGYAAFDGERRGFNASFLAFLGCVALGLWVLRRILFRG